MSSELQLDVCHLNRRWRYLVNTYEVKTRAWRKVMAAYCQWDDLKSHLRVDCLYIAISSGPSARSRVWENFIQMMWLSSVRRGDVLSAWSGIRPLVLNPNARDTQSIARNHIIEVSPSNLITIAGLSFYFLHLLY